MENNSCTQEKRQFVWSREMVTSLIHLYENYPCLYNIKLQEYHNKSRRNDAFKEICDELNKCHLTTLTVVDVKKKIHGLRTQYFSEINKIKKSRVSGASSDFIYIPKLWCYELLYFLNESTNVVSAGASNLHETHEEVESEVMSEVIFEGEVNDLENNVIPPIQPISSPATPHVRRPNSVQSGSSTTTTTRKRQRDDGIKDLIASATNTLQNLGRNELTKNALFGQMLASELDNIHNEGILDDLKQQLMSLIYEAKKRCREIQE